MAASADAEDASYDPSYEETPPPSDEGTAQRADAADDAPQPSERSFPPAAAEESYEDEGEDAAPLRDPPPLVSREEYVGGGLGGGADGGADLLTPLLLLLVLLLGVQALRKHKRAVLRAAVRLRPLRAPALRYLSSLPREVKTTDEGAAEERWGEEEQTLVFETPSAGEESEEIWSAEESEADAEAPAPSPPPPPREAKGRSAPLRRPREKPEAEPEDETDGGEEAAAEHADAVASCLSHLEGVLATGGVITLQSLRAARGGGWRHAAADGDFPSAPRPAAARPGADDEEMTLVGLQGAPPPFEARLPTADEEARWARLEAALQQRRERSSQQARAEKEEARAAARRRMREELLLMDARVEAAAEAADVKEAVGAAKWLVEYAYAHHLPEAVSKRQAAVEVSAARRLRFRAATAKAMRRLQARFAPEKNPLEVVGAERAVMAEEITKHAFCLATRLNSTAKDAVKQSPMFAADYGAEPQLGVMSAPACIEMDDDEEEGDEERDFRGGRHDEEEIEDAD